MQIKIYIVVVVTFGNEWVWGLVVMLLFVVVEAGKRDFVVMESISFSLCSS